MKVSVVIPCYNEIKTIDAILRKVMAACESMDYEVIVVDDGSSDATRDLSYYGRAYEQGKKIGWKDGVRAIVVILKHGLFRRPRPRTSSVSRPARVEASR